MAPITLYQIVNSATGAVTNQWLSIDAGPDHYEPSFGAPGAYVVLATDLTGTRRDPRMVALRSQRNQLLTGSDWTQVADSPLTADQKAAWAVYRQQLRALPDQANLNLDQITWPVPPS